MVRSSAVRIARRRAACRTVDAKHRRGILADDPVFDRFGRRRCLRPLRGCGKGGAVEFLGEVPFVRTERRGIGGFRHRRLCSVPCPVPCGSSMFCSEKREESSRLSVRGGAAHVCLSEQGPSPLRNAGRIRPATSETMDYPV